MEYFRSNLANQGSADGVVLPLRRRTRRSQSPARVKLQSSNCDAAFLLRTSAAIGSETLEVVDAEAGKTVTRWVGPVATVLLASQPVRAILRDRPQGRCRKETVRKLMLAASVAVSKLDTLNESIGNIVGDAESPLRISEDVDTHGSHGQGSTLSQRLRAMPEQLSLDSLTVARALFQHPGEHFTARDVEALIAASYPVSELSRVDDSLDELTRYDVIQRIEIAPSLVFYDIDVTPHAHRYDPATGRLFDA